MFSKIDRKNSVEVFIFAGLRPATLLKKWLRHTQVFFCQFFRIFKNIFFIELFRWLPLPILKPLDSQRQLCKWVSKLVTIYFISAFLVLADIFVFILGKDKLSFYISTVLWLMTYDVFDFSGDHTIEVSRELLGGAPSSWFSTLPNFGGHGPCECGDKTFLICHVLMWLMCQCHHTAKFKVHSPCESGNITFFIYHVTTILNCHMFLWVRSPHPKSPNG